MFASVPASESAISTRAIGSSNAPVKRATGYALAAAASVVLFGLLSPASAAAQQDRISTLTELPVNADAADGNNHLAMATPDRNAAMAVTARLPWLAPIGHRQPREINVSQNGAWSAWDRQQQRLEKELDRKLRICRC